MPAIAAVAIPAAASIVGGYLQHRSANNASKAQQRSADAALGYQKSRDTVSDQRYQDAWSDYQRRHAAWEARNFGGGAAPSGGGGGAAASSVSAGPAQAPIEMAGMMGAQQGGSLADVGPWSDWKKYGVGV
jgi:hypothetical protein